MAFVAPCGRQRAEYEGKAALPGKSRRVTTCGCKLGKSGCASGRQRVRSVAVMSTLGKAEVVVGVGGVEDVVAGRAAGCGVDDWDWRILVVESPAFLRLGDGTALRTLALLSSLRLIGMLYNEGYGDSRNAGAICSYAQCGGNHVLY